ncbi:hypothetical protein [Sphingomicrobium arenosum]|uniref:hypothetical protein n=1 Tax=Sphingomicrobium arenosum TaxID=2233861 RepID=UPI00223EA73C|nr:hypothetical protein [Sphingomicrobium arenosum]
MTSGGADTVFLWDGDELVMELAGASGDIIRRHVHGASVDDPVVTYEGLGTSLGALSHLVADRQGSIVALADRYGALQTINSYDPYGVPETRDAAGDVVTSRLVSGRFGDT